jgi:hypothetical protein
LESESSVFAAADSLGYVDNGVHQNGPFAARSYLSARRKALLQEYSAKHPSHALLGGIKYLDLPALVSLLSMHRVPLSIAHQWMG